MKKTTPYVPPPSPQPVYLPPHSRRSPDPEDKWSYGDWVDDLPVGGVVAHPAVPLVWNGGKPVG